MLIEKVCKQLTKHKVPYAVVGGYAVALHGAIRGTMDVDLVVKQTLQVYQQVETALHELGFESQLPVSANEVFHFRQEYISNRNMIAWSFYNPSNPAEIVDIIITHDLAKMGVVRKKAGNMSIPLLAIDDLIAMKTGTGRKQDECDIEALEKLK